MKHKTLLLTIARWLASAAVLAVLAGFFLEAPAGNASFSSVSSAVLSSTELSGAVRADDQLVRRLYGLDPSDLENCELWCPGDNMGARELLLVRVKDEAQMESVQKAVQARLDAQKAAFEGYAAEQFDLVQNHSAVETAGRTLLFVVSETSAETVRAFRTVMTGRDAG